MGDSYHQVPTWDQLIGRKYIRLDMPDQVLIEDGPR
jgi:hypothetical protein